MTSHTPGPWEEDLSADGEHMARMIANNPNWGAVATVSEDHGHVAYCHYSNARLIAAAPELLEALIAAKGTIEYLLANSDNGPAENCIEIIASAIAKAEGRSE